MSELKVGIKADQGKSDFSLLSAIWLAGVSRVLTKGKLKYDAHNWRNGLKIARLLASVLRHVTLYLAGQDLDVDPNCPNCQSKTCTFHTGEHHLDCAGAGIMFARELSLTRPDLDDRYKYNDKVLAELIRLIENPDYDSRKELP